VKNDFNDYFHEKEVVFEYDEDEVEEVNFDCPHQHYKMVAATNDSLMTSSTRYGSVTHWQPFT